MTQNYDVIIVGGGLSGILTAAKINAEFPAKKVALFEADHALGGRLASLDPALRPWAYGFSFINGQLYKHLDTLLKQDPSSEDLASFCPEKLNKIGILAGGKLTEFLSSDFFSAKAMKAYGGVSAAREWLEVAKIFESQDPDDKNFNHKFPISKKSSIATVLEAYARILGIPEFWHAMPQIFAARATELTEGMHCGAWSKPLTEILGRLQENFSLSTDCYVVSAKYFAADKQWLLNTRQGDVTCSQLVIAQSPWQAQFWLEKSTWPTPLLNVASKSKPVSTVCISYQIKNLPAGTAELTLIPSEDSCALIDHDGHVVFHSHIDFEMSLQAPSVMKSVKSLHRAAKKFAAALPGLELAHEHIALLPVGWSLSASAQDRKYFEKLDLSKLQQHHLMFVGEAYGKNLIGDVNILDSLQSAMNVVN